MAKEILKLVTDKTEQSTIIIGNDCTFGLLSQIDSSKYSHIFVLTDDVVRKCQESLFEQFKTEIYTIFEIVSGEDLKCIDTVESIWGAMQNAGCDRSSLLISIGGGVVSDLGGFCAATYMRGIDHVNIPTSLLSQVDASVGGKNGFNFNGTKNLIGTFSQPDTVLIDPHLLSTLPERQIIAGFAEIIKYGLIYDKDFFDFATSKHPRDFSEDELEKLIIGSCKIKYAIISQDIEENNLRKMVNFGHTIGHALESLSMKSEKPLLHGEAVSIGMVAESFTSNIKELLPNSDFIYIREKLKHAGLPVTFELNDDMAFLNAVRSDKKNFRGEIRCTLLTGIGSAVVNQPITKDIVLSAVHSLKDKDIE